MVWQMLKLLILQSEYPVIWECHLIVAAVFRVCSLNTDWSQWLLDAMCMMEHPTAQHIYFCSQTIIAWCMTSIMLVFTYIYVYITLSLHPPSDSNPPGTITLQTQSTPGPWHCKGLWPCSPSLAPPADKSPNPSSSPPSPTEALGARHLVPPHVDSSWGVCGSYSIDYGVSMGTLGSVDKINGLRKKIK